ncbi:MAG TPA: glycosyltransferase, partial [Gemmatimonadales bacterium]
VAGWIGSGGATECQILWATGKATHGEFRGLHNPPQVRIFDFLDPMADAYAVADLAVSRAGMMTVAELSAWGIPSVLIPLPTAAADHQTPNARVMAEAGGAIHLPQGELGPARLGEIVTGLFQSPDRLLQMAQAAARRGRPEAAQRIVDRIGILSG